MCKQSTQDLWEMNFVSNGSGRVDQECNKNHNKTFPWETLEYVSKMFLRPHPKRDKISCNYPVGDS